MQIASLALNLDLDEQFLQYTRFDIHMKGRELSILANFCLLGRFEH